MKKILLSLFAFAIIGSISFSIDSGPPQKEKISKIEKENVYVAQIAVVESPAMLTKETPAGEQYQMYAKSTASKDVSASVIDNATLFYFENDNKTKARSRDVSYTKLGYSKAYWPV